VIGGDSPYSVNYRSNQIGYANAGFETFELDIPDEVRGKAETLRFALGAGSYDVYLDDIAFQSPDLLFGNPTAARVQFDPNLNQADNDTYNSVHENNYLIEKPQYTVAYSHSDNTPLWASWQLNKTWLGTLGREDFESDTRLPASWYKVKDNDYSQTNNLSELQIPGPLQPNGQPYVYQAGHIVPAADRDRNRKDAYEVALLDNIVPQHQKNNAPLWSGLEQFSRDLVEEKGKELYIIAGRGGSSDVIRAYNASEYINVPDYLWKVIVVLDRPGQGIADITPSTKVIAVTSQNTLPTSTASWYAGGMNIVSVVDLEQMLNDDPINQARGIHYNFFSNLPSNLQSILKSQVFIPGTDPLGQFADLSASLFANSGTLLGSVSPNTTVWHNGIQQNSIIPNSFSQLLPDIGSSEVGTSQIGIITKESIQSSIAQVNVGEVSSRKISIFDSSISQIGTSQIGRAKGSPSQIATTEIGIGESGTIQTAISQGSTTQVSINQDNSLHINFIKPSVDQIDTSKVPIKLDIIYPISTEVALPSRVSFTQFSSFDLKNHDLTPLLNNIYSTAQSIWHTTTPINLNFEVTNLPTGQLAEATITGYDQLGRPNTATISIDDDANGVGWFIDTTPGDNSEFTGTDTYFQATPNSAASGKYDLLTALLHEMGHTLGFINGYSQFNQNIKGRQFYTDSTHSYTLSSDLSHLDNTLYPNDLLNTNLKPGIRKLPSSMDWAIINAISGSGGVGVLGSTGVSNPAHLTAGALIGITNGDFTTPTTWNTEGATNIINGTATLTEQSQKLSELTQAFIIPTGAKTLQFTIKDNHLVGELAVTTVGGVGGNKAPGDAFEVALLDTNTFNPLAGTSIGLNHTDSLLNIQANGTIFHSDKVTITALGNNSSIVTIDLTQVAPSTQATLYFNLLGFGARTSTVTIDDVKLFTDTQPIPVTKNDTLATTQNTPLTLDPTQLTTNDTNVTQIQIINQPTHGTLTLNPPLPLPGGDFTYTYTPDPTYVGIDSFTYLGFGSDGQISNLATVNLTINNLAPTIETVLIPNQINEGQTIQLQATAKDGGRTHAEQEFWLIFTIDLAAYSIAICSIAII
jgi:DNA/RNA endonuclease G (NUC1)